MKIENLKYAICPYGRTTDTIKVFVKQGTLDFRSANVVLIDTDSFKGTEDMQVVWVTSSRDLDQKFVERFREHSSFESRLLVINDRQTTDALCTSLLDLQIRKSERLYVADCIGSGPNDVKVHLKVMVQRLFAALGGGEKDDRILDASIDSDSLRVVSANFKRLIIPISQIPALAAQDESKVATFEIDEDGSFVYWPKLDVHLGWDQLEQVVNPVASLRAKQRSSDFNLRYGKAVQKVREQSGIKPTDVIDMSPKQLGRIEAGECRLTSNAMEALAKAHGMTANAYLKKLAEAMPT